MKNDVKVIEHNLSCRCHRREETFEIEGKSFTVQYSILHNTTLKRIKYLDNYLRKRSYLISTNKMLNTLGFPSNWHLTTNPIKQ